MFAVETREIPFGDWTTWARITEPAALGGERPPLIVLHGGPGFGHNYVRSISELASTGRAVIQYDQLGCGNSTHLPSAEPGFWSPGLFVDEFHNLVERLGIERFHLLGQSWGGMLAAEIAVRRPAGLVSLALCNTPASMTLWAEGADRLRAQLPADVREVMRRHEGEGTITHPDYLAATDVFYERHLCRVVPMPQDLRESIEVMEADPTVYETLQGPNEFLITGSLKDWTIVDRLSAIEVPTLVVAGEFDEAVPETWQPLLDEIPRVRSIVFPDASHCVHLERPEAFRAEIARFLAENDD